MTRQKDSILLIFMRGCPACVRDKPRFTRLMKGLYPSVSLTMYDGTDRVDPQFNLEYYPSYYLIRNGIITQLRDIDHVEQIIGGGARLPH